MSADQVTVSAALPTIPRQQFGAADAFELPTDVLTSQERPGGSGGPRVMDEDLSSAGSWAWDTDGEVVRWPPVIHRILGTLHSPDAATWPTFLARVHADDRDALSAQIRQAAASGEVFTSEFRISKENGSERELRAVGWGETDNRGRIKRLVGTIQDVTRERLSSRALRRSRDLFAGVLEAATEQAIIATDLDGVISVFNTGAERMLGWSSDDVVGETTDRFHDPEEMAGLATQWGIQPGLRAFLQHVAVPDPETRRCTYITRDGHRRQVLLTVTRMRDSQGRPSGFIKIATDVTDQLLAQAVVDSEMRFRNTFEYAPNGMMLIDLNLARPGRLIQVNPALCDLTGHHREALLTMAVTDLIAADHRLPVEGYWEDLASGRCQGVSLEQRWIDADGDDLWVQFNVSPRASERDHYVVAQVENITARKHVELRLTHQTLHDNLTGLPNRMLLMDRITHALAGAHRSRLGVAVLYLDLDGFKAINDTSGHAAGDHTLQQVANRLQHSLRPGDTVARLGGDEFVAVCPDIDTVDTATAIAERVLAVLREPYVVGPRSFVVGASIGISLSTDDSSPDQLLHDADQAMYGAKSEGKGRVRVGVGNDPELASRTARAERSMRIEAELTRAVATDELVMYGQVVVDVASGATVAVENLVRWRHPERGLLPPAEFLDVAEDGPIIMALGRRVLHESCRMAATWVAALGDAAPAVHVNISGRQLESGHLYNEVVAALEHYSLPPQQLILELTETHTPLLADSLRRDIVRMRDHGVRLAIDDVGTGYSSLSRITELPVDILKIDMSFIRRMDTVASCAAVVRGILAIGNALGLDVIGEGVETAAQAAQLAEWGCTAVQGYLYGRPVDEDTLLQTLLARNAAPSAPS